MSPFSQRVSKIPTMTTDFVSRGGQKLAAALEAFGIAPSGRCCVDLGSHVGGFVDCLLQRGAKRVYAVDTCYGTLAWRLRRDPRVKVFERTNALHFTPPAPVTLVTIDVGWTRQELILRSARNMLTDEGDIITLVKPHYEVDQRALVRGVLPETTFTPVVQRVLDDVAQLGLRVAGTLESPLRGHGGNRELLAHLQPRPGLEPGGEPPVRHRS